MTGDEATEFVRAFESAWAARDGDQFFALWHEEGVLRSPFYDRPVAGKELGVLNDAQKHTSPDLVWRLLEWTWRDSVVMIEWECTNRYGERRVSWRGVDRFLIRDGRIAEEVVYVDTAPMQAARTGKPIEPLVRVPQ
jgi:ketosteroid isomerase-like protein